MSEPTIAVVMRPIAGLIPYAGNARTHSDEQIAQVAASIREFGWTNPVLVDGDNGIIAGHCRVLAAMKLGQERVPCISLAGLNETQKKAYVVADNQLATVAYWDAAMLAVELNDLRDADFDVSLLGFAAGEMDALLRGPDNALGDEPAAGSIGDAGADMECCPKCGFQWKK